jgi:hypothetical protein
MTNPHGGDDETDDPRGGVAATMAKSAVTDSVCFTTRSASAPRFV